MNAKLAHWVFGWSVWAGVLVIGAVADRAAADPPRVVLAQPDMGDVGVDPGLKEMIVEFDQDMAVGGVGGVGGGGGGGGFSICGSRETSPQTAGQMPRWATPRKVVIPVMLEPGRAYRLSINCPGARNFRSVKGEAAEIHPIQFRTRAEGEEGPVITEAQAESVWAALVKGIEERYSYKDLRAERGLDWAGLFEKHGPGVRAARTPGELGRRIAAMLRPTGDLHICVRVGAGKGAEPFVLAAGRREVDPNIDVRSLPERIDGWTPLGGHAAGGMYKGVPYLLIGDWGGAGREYEPVMEFLGKHKGAESFILDVRPNSGGDESIARKVAGWFVAEKTVYSKSRIRDPGQNGGQSGGEGGWTPVHERAVTPTGDHPLSDARVAVLIGPAVMSSCESFVLMMRHGAEGRAKLIGSRTFGSTGRPMPLELSPGAYGVTVLLPSWVDYDVDGTVVEGNGVRPDIEVRYTRDREDEVLERAVEELKK
ncbi:MAG: hypothetical protein IT438_16450 [Phycisphaerales bacterium]|nr:hypothetical protein [Phycisphaerales bacterium]